MRSRLMRPICRPKYARSWSARWAGAAGASAAARAGVWPAGARTWLCPETRALGRCEPGKKMPKGFRLRGACRAIDETPVGGRRVPCRMSQAPRLAGRAGGPAGAAGVRLRDGMRGRGRGREAWGQRKAVGQGSGHGSRCHAPAGAPPTGPLRFGDLGGRCAAAISPSPSGFVRGIGRARARSLFLLPARSSRSPSESNAAMVAFAALALSALVATLLAVAIWAFLRPEVPKVDVLFDRASPAGRIFKHLRSQRTQGRQGADARRTGCPGPERLWKRETETEREWERKGSERERQRASERASERTRERKKKREGDRLMDRERNEKW